MSEADLADPNKIDPWLLNQKFFHGFLSREDLPALLQNHGDFLVRCNEGDKTQPREVVVSVLYDPDGKSKTADQNGKLEATRNFVVQSALSNKTRKYFIDSRDKFESLEDLLAHHSETPLVVNQTEVLFKRAIRLAKWEFTSQSVQVGKLLSTGAFGEVRQGKLTKKDGSVVDVAVKMMKGRSDTCKQQVKEMVREARVMRDLSHPNIVHFYGVCLQEQPIYILLELIQGQPLDVYLLENKSTIDKDEKLQIIMGIAWGLEYLHSMSVIHRDISAKNCHYDTSKVVRLSEFSLSRQGTTYAMKTARKMPIKWLAPESIRTFMFTQKSDVYNYGVFIYEVFACTEPYAKLSTNAAKDAILGGTLNDFPAETPEKLAHYVKDKMWQTDPDKREDMAHIKPWLEIFTGLTLVVERKKKA